MVNTLLAGGAAVDLQDNDGAFRASGEWLSLVQCGCVFRSCATARLHWTRLYQRLY
jgi:hypothetical protein